MDIDSEKGTPPLVVDDAIHVVAAIIVQDNKVLACRRAPHKSSPGLWEFPGGKVDFGEDPFTALEREIREELNLACEPQTIFDVSETALEGQVIRLESIVCFFVNNPELSSTDHDEFLWCEKSQLLSLAWAAPDLPAVAKLAALRSFADLDH